MPSMNDAARMMAAADGAGMDMGPAPDPGMVDAMDPDAQGDPTADLAGALDMIEGAVAGMPPEIQEKARVHIEALRAVAEEAGAAVAQGGPAPEAAPEEAPPTPGPGEKGELL